MGSLTNALTLLDATLEILLPRECLVCTRPLRGHSLCFRCTPQMALPDGHPRCARCFSVLRESLPTGSTCATCESFPPPGDRIRYLWEYEGLARDLIRSMKFRPSITLARLGGETMAHNLERLFIDREWDALVPVPASPSMARRRRFHPCYELARAISIHHPRLKIISPLRHMGRRAPQSTLSHDERLRGLKGSFTLTRHPRVKGKRILIVEDVITTGATLSTISKILQDAGAARIDVLALAQARVWNRFRARLFQAWNPPKARREVSLKR